MTRKRQLVWVAAVGCALLSASTLLGDPAHRYHPDPAVQIEGAGNLQRLVQDRLRQPGVLTYETLEKKLLFALKLQPNLPAVPRKPRDFAILFDTTASQAGETWLVQLALLKDFVHHLAEDDRLWILLVNTQPAELTPGFITKQDGVLQKAFRELSELTPMGAADLRAALDKVLERLENRPDRQQVVVYIGDGMSTLRPLGLQDRLRYAEQFNRLRVNVYAIPIGFRLDPEFLNGLSTSTGGAVWRVDMRFQVPELWRQWLAQLDTPILYPSEIQLPPEVVEAFPVKLPPLRGDSPTLVVGQLRELPQKFVWKVKGLVREQAIEVSQEEKVWAPEVTMFCLKALVEQAKKHREAPALLPADRMLAMAHDQARLAREELLAQGRIAVRLDRLDLARDLFEQAHQLDPHDPEARAAIRLVERLQNAPDAARRRELLGNAVAQAGGAPPAGGAGGGGAPAAGGKPDPVAEDLLQRQEQLIRVQEQQLQSQVDELLRGLRRQLTAAEGNELLARLKLLTEVIARQPQISPQVRQQLLERLAAGIRNLERRLEEQRRLEAEAQAREVAAQEMARRQEQIQDEQARIREMMQQFQVLVQANRFMEAYRKGLQILQMAPQQAVGVAASSQALSQRYLGEAQRLVQERQAKYLAAMLEIERSHVPFPDEPPIAFAPASFYETKIFRNWNELSRHRIKRWLVSYLGEAPSERALEIERMLSQPSPLLPQSFPQDTPLKVVLDTIEKKLNIPIRIDYDAFGEDANKFDPEQLQLKKTIRCHNMSLGMILHDVLASVEPQATYIIRRDTIEVTSPQKAIAEKVLRVYPVPELVLPPLFGGNPFQLSTMLFGLGFQMGIPMMMWGGAMMGMAMGLPGMAVGAPGALVGGAFPGGAFAGAFPGALVGGGFPA
ncbi:MAG: VWA domain-containing protein [Gemmatales bacterium]|nr:VWA domain-containing protein [Gemmatales bacterium]